MTKTAPVRVDHNGRRFYVEFVNNEAVRINERKTYKFFGVEQVYMRTYWVASSHSLGKGNTIPKRVIEAAKAKLNAPAS